MRVTIASVVVPLLAIALVQVVAVSAEPRRGQRQGYAPSRTLDSARATLTGTVYDPLGLPIADMLVSIESGPFGSGVSGETTTDKAGKYTFEKLPPGVYTISVPIDFAPTIEVRVDAGRLVRHDIRMHVEEVVGTFLVCVDCEQAVQRYTPPDSLVKEFASDRDATSKQAVRGAEPAVGWEYYQPDVRVTEVIRERGLIGTVVIEARVEPDGTLKQVTVVSSPHSELSAAAVAALQNDRWIPAMVRDVPVAVPLNLTIEFTRRKKP